MTLLELIKEAQRLHTIHGDLPVVYCPGETYDGDDKEVTKLEFRKGNEVYWPVDNVKVTSEDFED